jgi:2'-5' RNA ligase
MPERALVILVPEAELIVHSFRERFDPSARQEMPAHITILYPFLSGHSIEGAARVDLEDLFRAHPQFDFSLREVKRFPGVLYLAPEPSEPFDRLIAEVCKKFQESPPYAGSVGRPVPHLTIADVGQRFDLDSIEREFLSLNAALLPVSATAKTVTLMALRDSKWQREYAFALRG